MFRKILIANRGEIAVRIIRACRELGIRVAVVASDADLHSLPVRLADEVIEIGPAPVKQSYLNVESILDAARRSAADAIHPGYGLLSENANFAQAVQQAGFVFIGPSPQAIAAMGDKAAARLRMQAAGVPVVPGFQDLSDDASLIAAAAQLTLPVMVKAAAGGGGKGMRIVHALDDLPEAIAAARREALHAFGDDRLILEQFIPQAHHVEFQVLGDQHGNLLHIFERECSVQRRHQKIIEESPSPLMDADLRQQMGEAAIAAAKAVQYNNAGTIEFILDPRTRQFYFLEMNTRLQVEHPVTEMVSGLDLVQWQIRIAAGEKLPFTQSDLIQRGHAIECRLYAEDPQHSFLPASGDLLRFQPPQGIGIRVDSGVTEGDAISVHYDPLIAKLVCSAEDRPAAIRRMLAALNQTVLLGLTSNLHFLKDVLNHPDFLAGQVHTTWVEQHFADWQPAQCGIQAEVLIAAALAQSLEHSPGDSGAISTPSGVFSPWNSSSSFRIGQAGDSARRQP